MKEIFSKEVSFELDTVNCLPLVVTSIPCHLFPQPRPEAIEGHEGKHESDDVQHCRYAELSKDETNMFIDMIQESEDVYGYGTRE